VPSRIEESGVTPSKSGLLDFGSRHRSSSSTINTQWRKRASSRSSQEHPNVVLMPWYRRMDLLPLSLSFLIHARVDVAVFVVPIAFITPFYTPCGQPHPSSCLPHVSSHLPWLSRHPLQPAFAMVGWHTFFGISRPMFLDQKIIQQKYVSATCLSLQRSYYFLAFLLSFVFCYACCFHGKVGFTVVHLPTAALNVGPLPFELLLVMIVFLQRR